jgi:16S rRNA (guanine527-N7)-methyltransferase
MSADGGAATASGETLDLSADRDHALSLTPVSRETAARLDRFVALLIAWEKHTNLIARSTIPVIWTRHIADSLQLLPLAPQAKVWADLGSGAGFPGLVLACALGESRGAEVHLVESIGKKAAFLREAVQVTGAPAIVHAMRVEDFVDKGPESIEVVTARALAPLPKLLPLAYPLLKKGAVGLFPKGQDVGSELTDAAKYWKIQSDLVRSRTDQRAQILIVKALEPQHGGGLGKTAHQKPHKASGKASKRGQRRP